MNVSDRIFVAAPTEPPSRPTAFADYAHFETYEQLCEIALAVFPKGHMNML